MSSITLGVNLCQIINQKMKSVHNTNESLSHVDAEGKARMVDISSKDPLARKAVASGFIRLSEDTIQAVSDNEIKKGDVLAVAQIAGIQAAKQTSLLIPLCHSLLLDSVEVEMEIVENGIKVECRAQCHGKTGVEMEALTGTSVALLTIYDMCKAIDKQMSIGEIVLINKEKKEIG